MEYTCDRCGYATKTLQTLQRHLSRKNLCKPVISDITVDTIREKLIAAAPVYRCITCNKIFSCRQNKHRHEKNCTKDVILTNMQNEINILKQKVEEHDKIASVQNNTNCNNTINNITNNIQINTFGEENIGYILNSPNFKQFFCKVLERGELGLLELIEQKLFNKEHPENHTVRKLIKKNKYVDCYNGEKWEKQILKDIICKIFVELENDINCCLKQLSDTKHIPSKYSRIYANFKSDVADPLNYDLIWDEDTKECDIAAGEDEDLDSYNNRLRNKIIALTGAFLYEKSKEILAQIN